MVSLIRLSIFQLHNKILSFNISISPPLNEELYKIKTKFKFFVERFIPDFQNLLDNLLVSPYDTNIFPDFQNKLNN